ncbi:MAG: DNA-directed RNA polymerase subunit beta [Anaerolineales bacterium]|nr:MAG: DNA-directed RNA polymerase subunit beta [Anaerolineales bacterium]
MVNNALRKSYTTIPDVHPLPNLVKVQLDSYRWFQQVGLEELFNEISPIVSFNKNLELHFLSYRFDESKYTEEECRDRDMTYASPLWVQVRLINKETGEIQEQEVFMGDFPLMTENGTFIINGAERVVVSQLIRSPGVYFTVGEDRATGRQLCMAKLIPNRGAWLEFETGKKDVLSVKVDRKRKIPVTVLLRAVLGIEFDKDEAERRRRWKELWNRARKVDPASKEEWNHLIDELTAERLWWIGWGQPLSAEQEAIVRADTEYRLEQEAAGYTERCWGNTDHRVSSQVDELCPECGWYICSHDGRCQGPHNTWIGVGESRFSHRCSGRYHIYQGNDEELIELFSPHDSMPEHSYIKATIERDPTKSVDRALLEFYKKLRPGDPPTLDNARSFLTSLFFSSRRYDMAKVGRHKLDKRLDLDVPLFHRTLTREDLVKVVEHIIMVNNGVDSPDDIDHLGNRRIKTVGELIQNQLRIGLLRMERVVRERMSIRDPEQLIPISLINIRPVVAATREFFGGSQLSQFMDQTNPLAELTHKRRLSALGPGGLRRERAGFDVRDVHHSHYGRICPIETPEGPNIGLIGSLATYGRINEYGFIETPYSKVVNTVPNEYEQLLEKTLRERIVDLQSGEVVAEAGTFVTAELADRIASLPLEDVKIVPIVINEIVHLSADEEDTYTIAQANARLDGRGQFVDSKVSVRRSQRFLMESVEKVDFMDVSPKQIVSVSAALIPFLEHDDANRALMGSNMQRQAVPLLNPEAPLVGTGMERQAALDSGHVVVAEEDGEVVSVTSRQIVVMEESGLHIYPLRRYNRSNQSTCIDQRPVVDKGDQVKKGDTLADSSSIEHGELALGQNILVAFMSWEGGNYEDAILTSESMVREDKFTSIHIEKHEVEARDTKLGPEEITRDIPNVGEDALKDLDENGIVRIGAEVGPGDILVGKITPKGETELTPEEKLLRAIFGEKAREVKDSSLRLPHGEKGKVVDIKVFGREEHRDLPAGVDKLVRVSVAQKRKITEGDKMAGRHGNKGVISKVVPIEDMPFLADGTPVEIILNPLGVPARMNIGQILETHLGWAADQLGFRVISSVFDGADEEEIAAELARAWLMGRAWEDVTERAWQWLKEAGYGLQDIRDDDEARLLYIIWWLRDKGYDEDLLAFDQTYARRATLWEWLRERGYDSDKLIVLEGDERSLPEREEADRCVRGVCLREWLRHMREKESRIGTWKVETETWRLEEGGYGIPSLVPDPETIADEKLYEVALQVSRATGEPLPTAGKMILYDGKKGEPFDQPVTVGVINMMKLAHLVEDKVHARSTGPYSLVTQQPLGGKAQFGGQRFGEMEVWALEAYGAAHILQEMLTVKSDDVIGRVKTYEAIVKGQDILEPGVPESFRVLIKELQALGLFIEVLNENNEMVPFGREDSEEKLPKLGLGLNLPPLRRRRGRG